MNSNTTTPVTNTGGRTPGAQALTVDLQINRVVLDAASARLPLVQAMERQRYGRAKTSLSTLAEDILKGWKPGQTKRTPAPGTAKCKHCWRVVKTYATGKLRVHGPAGDRCPPTWATGEGTSQDTSGPERADTRPLRFPMNRAEYENIKEAIHEHDQSVASVVSQRLAHFARTGAL